MVAAVGLGPIVERRGGSSPSAGTKKTKGNKMGINLEQTLIDKLTDLPETGMGYQIVDVVFSDGSSLSNCTVVNCDVLRLPSYFILDDRTIKDVNLSKQEEIKWPEEN